MVSRAEVDDQVRQGKMESEGSVNPQITSLQETIDGELQKIMAVAASTDAKVEALGAESERAMKLVMAESEKFAVQVATDKAEMDARTETFRTAGAALEAQLSEGLTKIKTAQSAADAAHLIQAADPLQQRDQAGLDWQGGRRRDDLASPQAHLLG